MLGLGLAGTISIVLAGCSTNTSDSSAGSPKDDPQVALFGDSLAAEAQPYWTELTRAAKEVGHTYDSYGGTAICDWLAKMQEVEMQYHPVAVEIEFSGNNLTPCMSGLALYSPQYYAKYEDDTMRAIDIFTAGGAHVLLVGAPITKAQQSVPDWQHLNQQYEQIASAQPAHVSYVDAGTAVEGPGHSYADTLPCLKDEDCTGPIVDGVRSNIVRSSDGTHFCPTEVGDQSGVIGGCAAYSSGAYRYAKAMVDALRAFSSRR